ncbi:MAG: hypothetical protein HOV68_19260 [Streptomycetaceae bacterium]|nr:hypothetical protein [Streptomycetaceae bacterium]
MDAIRRALQGPGRFPAELRAELAYEGLLACEEGLVGSISYRNYRSPERSSPWSREAICGAVALSRRRLVVWDGRVRHIDLDLALLHGGAALDVRTDRADRLVIGYDAAQYRDRCSGQVEIRLRTPRAGHIARTYAASVPMTPR